MGSTSASRGRESPPSSASRSPHASSPRKGHARLVPGMGDRRSTDAGIEIRPLYGPDDLQGFDPERDLGHPGDPPFTRGVYPTMYRGRLWTMRQYAGMGTAKETNARFRYLLEHGQTGLSIAFD